MWIAETILNDIIFVEGAQISGEQIGILKKIIINKCAELKDQIIGVLDVMAPPDCAMNSIFGCFDGNIYEKYINAIYGQKDTF